MVFLSALPVAGVETDFAVDSTGFRTTTFSAYEGDKYGRSKEHRWLKAHMCVGAKTNIVTAVIVTDGSSNDSPQFSPLIKQTAEGFAIGEVSADLAYSSRNNLEVVNKVGGMPCYYFYNSIPLFQSCSKLDFFLDFCLAPKVLILHLKYLENQTLGAKPAYPKPFYIKYFIRR